MHVINFFTPVIYNSLPILLLRATLDIIHMEQCLVRQSQDSFINIKSRIVTESLVYNKFYNTSLAVTDGALISAANP
jgi:hypothetical protein